MEFRTRPRVDEVAEVDPEHLRQGRGRRGQPDRRALVVGGEDLEAVRDGPVLECLDSLFRLPERRPELGGRQEVAVVGAGGVRHVECVGLGSRIVDAA